MDRRQQRPLRATVARKRLSARRRQTGSRPDADRAARRGFTLCRHDRRRRVAASEDNERGARTRAPCRGGDDQGPSRAPAGVGSPPCPMARRRPYRPPRHLRVLARKDAGTEAAVLGPRACHPHQPRYPVDADHLGPDGRDGFRRAALRPGEVVPQDRTARAARGRTRGAWHRDFLQGLQGCPPAPCRLRGAGRRLGSGKISDRADAAALRGSTPICESQRPDSAPRRARDGENHARKLDPAPQPLSAGSPGRPMPGRCVRAVQPGDHARRTVRLQEGRVYRRHE